MILRIILFYILSVQQTKTECFMDRSTIFHTQSINIEFYTINLIQLFQQELEIFNQIQTAQKDETRDYETAVLSCFATGGLFSVTDLDAFKTWPEEKVTLQIAYQFYFDQNKCFDLESNTVFSQTECEKLITQISATSGLNHNITFPAYGLLHSNINTLFVSPPGPSTCLCHTTSLSTFITNIQAASLKVKFSNLLSLIDILKITNPIEFDKLSIALLSLCNINLHSVNTIQDLRTTTSCKLKRGKRSILSYLFSDNNDNIIRTENNNNHQLKLGFSKLTDAINEDRRFLMTAGTSFQIMTQNLQSLGTSFNKMFVEQKLIDNLIELKSDAIDKIINLHSASIHFNIEVNHLQQLLYSIASNSCVPLCLEICVVPCHTTISNQNAETVFHLAIPTLKPIPAYILTCEFSKSGLPSFHNEKVLRRSEFLLLTNNKKMKLDLLNDTKFLTQHSMNTDSVYCFIFNENKTYISCSSEFFFFFKNTKIECKQQKTSLENFDITKDSLRFTNQTIMFSPHQFSEITSILQQNSLKQTNSLSIHEFDELKVEKSTHILNAIHTALNINDLSTSDKSLVILTSITCLAALMSVICFICKVFKKCMCPCQKPQSHGRTEIILNELRAQRDQQRRQR